RLLLPAGPEDAGEIEDGHRGDRHDDHPGAGHQQTAVRAHAFLLRSRPPVSRHDGSRRWLAPPSHPAGEWLSLGFAPGPQRRGHEGSRGGWFAVRYPGTVRCTLRTGTVGTGSMETWISGRAAPSTGSP